MDCIVILFYLSCFVFGFLVSALINEIINYKKQKDLKKEVSEILEKYKKE